MHRTIFFLLGLLLCTSVLNADDALPEKHWEVSQTADWIRLTTHGQTVHGHRFGLLKSPNACRYDMLYITLSTYDKAIESVDIDEVLVEFKTEETRFTIPADYLGSVHLFGPVYGITLSNTLMNEPFITLLEKSAVLQIAITSPSILMRHLEVVRETFDLNGFAKGYDQAAALCIKVKKASSGTGNKKHFIGKRINI